MNKQKEKVPDLRFKGFTDDWEQRKLNNYLKLSNIKNTYNKFSKEDVLSVSGVYGIVNQIEFQGRSFAGNNLENYKVVYPKDIVYTKSPIKVAPYGIIKANWGKPGIVSTLYAVYTPKANVNSHFIENYFEDSWRINKYLKPIVNIGAKHDMKVKNSEVINHTVVFPGKNEQNKICDLLSSLNSTIALQQRKLDLLNQLKKGLLQKMFADKDSKRPILRFGGFTDDWEQCKLGDISEKTYSGLSGKSKEDFGHGNAKYITYLNVHDNAIADPEETDKVEIDSKQNNVIQGDLLFTVSSEVPEEVALNSVWPIDSKNIYLNSFCFGLRPLSNKINSFFLTYYLRSPKMRKAVYPLAQGISRFNISKKNILKLDINIPEKTEQAVIYRSLKLIEDIIAIQQQKLSKVNEIKKSLLQQMFI